MATQQTDIPEPPEFEPPARPAEHPVAPPRDPNHPLPDPNNVPGHRAGGRVGLWRLIIIIMAVFAVLFVFGLLPRLLRQPTLKRDVAEQKDTTPIVDIVPVQKPAASDVLSLPGNIQAIEQTSITARASGYIQRWLVDIGDRVKAGQVLAIISTPDVDQEVTQARAQLSGTQAALSQALANVVSQRANAAQAQAELARSQAALAQARTQFAQSQAALAQTQETSDQQNSQLTQAQANLNLARVTAQRYENLLADGAIDEQTTDQNVASYKSNQANVQALQSALRASRANVAASRDAVLSSKANVSAYSEGVRSSRATLLAAQANVVSYQAQVVAAQQNVRSNQANLQRLIDLQGYQKVTAPFSGVVTARNVDNGALISASGSVSGDSSSVGSGSAGTTTQGNAAGGSSTGSGSSPGVGTSTSSTSSSLFSIAQTDVLRIFISVPQAYSGMVHVGQQAQILVRELPGHPFLGKVTRDAVALDAASRTLVTEIDVQNQQGLMRPGMFATVRLRVPHPGNDLLIPDASLITNTSGNQALVVSKDSKLHFQPITVGRDFGQVIQVTSGLQAGENIVANPNDALKEGEKVHAMAAPAATQGG